MHVPEAAIEANREACEAIGTRDFVAAIDPAERARRLAPEWAAPWCNLSVAYKHAKRWRECIDASQRGTELEPESATGLQWNLGIAATALGEWARARAAWTSAGVRVPRGSGAIHMPIGPTPIRVGVNEAPEVVWCDRIDPCRARIRSVPLPESKRRYDDLVLHDGEPRGKRRLNGELVSVFDELDLLERSRYSTFRVEARLSTPEQCDALAQALADGDRIVEDWTDSVAILCTECSLGTPDHEHHEPPKGWKPERVLGVATTERTLVVPSSSGEITAVALVSE